MCSYELVLFSSDFNREISWTTRPRASNQNNYSAVLGTLAAVSSSRIAFSFDHCSSAAGGCTLADGCAMSARELTHLRAHNLRSTVHGEVGHDARLCQERSLRCNEAEVLKDRWIVHQGLGVPQNTKIWGTLGATGSRGHTAGLPHAVYTLRLQGESARKKCIIVTARTPHDATWTRHWNHWTTPNIQPHARQKYVIGGNRGKPTTVCRVSPRRQLEKWNVPRLP